MGLMKNFFSQTRKPEGLLGKVMLNGMNPGHAKLADWGFTHLPELTPERAIDIGCGGGRNAGELLRMYPKGHVTAIDYSDLSVAKARDYNRDMRLETSLQFCRGAVRRAAGRRRQPRVSGCFLRPCDRV